MAHVIDRIYIPYLNGYPWTVVPIPDNEEAAGTLFEHRCGEAVVLDSTDGPRPLLDVLDELHRHAKVCESVGPDLQNIYRGTSAAEPAPAPERP